MCSASFFHVPVGPNEVFVIVARPLHACIFINNNVRIKEEEERRGRGGRGGRKRTTNS